MMHIPIHNHHLLQAMLLLNIPNRDRDVIEKTKTHSPIRLGMMPRRPHSAKGLVNFVIHDGINRGQCPACRQISRIQSFG
jgi:hypothetical protein